MDAERKWTKGPWRIAGKGTIRAGDGWVADVHWRNREANAALIFAAPDMAEALLAIVERGYVSQCIEEERGDYLAAVAALRKAGAL